MQPQIIRNLSPNNLVQPLAPHNQSRMMSKKIENISNLMSSLNAAVQDLEGTQMPPLNDDFDFYVELRRFQVNLINTALRLSGGSQVKAARLLKLKATTLNAKMKALHLPRK